MKKYLTFAAITAMLLASGCTARDLPLTSTTALGDAAEGELVASTELGTVDGYAETEIAWEEAPAQPEELSSPPVMRIEAVGEMIASCMNMPQCGYSWTKDDSETIACGASPYQAYELGHVSAVINTLDLAKAPKVLLTNGGVIEYVTCWGSDEERQDVEFTAEGEILLPDSPIGKVYEVSILFPQGRCSYLFATEEREPTDYSGGSEGATTPAYDPTALQSPAAYISEAICGYPTAEDFNS